MTTVREIAELAGVSKSTVSLVLNDKPGVSDAKRQMVLEARRQLLAKAAQFEMEAPPNEVELPKRTDVDVTERKTHGDLLSIVVLHPPVLNSSYVFSEVLRGIQSAAETYNVQLRLVTNDPDATKQHVSRLYFTSPALRPDGLLVFGAQQHEPLLEEANRMGIPCVVLGRDASKYDVSGLGRDEHRHAAIATNYLIELGHRAIGFLGGEQVYDYLHNRLRGYTQALANADIKTSDTWVCFGTGEQATRQILASAPEVTAILYVNDNCAQNGLPVLDAANLSVPDDMSVISFDDTDIAQNHRPPLTSISYKHYEEGQWAVKMLVDQIRYPYLERVQAIFHASLIKRESCAPPRQL